MCFVLLRGAPFCSVVLRLAPQQFAVLRGAPDMIRCSVSAPSVICSSVVPGPLVRVLLDILYNSPNLLQSLYNMTEDHKDSLLRFYVFPVKIKCREGSNYFFQINFSLKTIFIISRHSSKTKRSPNFFSLLQLKFKNYSV